MSPALSLYTEAEQQMPWLVFPGLDHYLNFLRFPKDGCLHLQATESTLENATPTFLRGGVGGFGW